MNYSLSFTSVLSEPCRLSSGSMSRLEKERGVVALPTNVCSDGGYVFRPSFPSLCLPRNRCPTREIETAPPLTPCFGVLYGGGDIRPAETSSSSFCRLSLFGPAFSSPFLFTPSMCCPFVSPSSLSLSCFLSFVVLNSSLSSRGRRPIGVQFYRAKRGFQHFLLE